MVAALLGRRAADGERVHPEIEEARSRTPDQSEPPLVRAPAPLPHVITETRPRIVLRDDRAADRMPAQAIVFVLIALALGVALGFWLATAVW